MFANQYAQTDIQIADQILAGNVDKVIVAYNSETFDNELYEEIVMPQNALCAVARAG